MSIILNEGTKSERVDMVFDVYSEYSIKNAKRLQRGCKSGHQLRNIVPHHKIRQWRKILLSPTNKMQLIRFISQEGQKERLPGKTLFVTRKEKCFKITSENEVQERPHVNTRGGSMQHTRQHHPKRQYWWRQKTLTHLSSENLLPCEK